MNKIVLSAVAFSAICVVSITHFQKKQIGIIEEDILTAVQAPEEEEAYSMNSLLVHRTTFLSPHPPSAKNSAKSSKCFADF